MKAPRPPYPFDEFFASDKEESVSPFLSPSARKWSQNLPLKVSLSSAVFLAVAFALRTLSPDLSTCFLLFVYALSGTPALINSIEDIKALDLNIDLLMTLAALLSVLIGSGLEGGLLLVLFELSGSMEKSVTQKTKSILAKLHELSPTTANVLDEKGHVTAISIKDVPIGVKILLQAGEISPLDGVVLEGSSFITVGHLTGESAPLPKKAGDSLPAGAKNLDGSLTIKVTRKGEESTLSQIIALITKAQQAKPKLQRWIDTFDKKYATTIIILTILFASTLPLVFHFIPFLGVEGSIYRSLTFLIAASPCALVIGAPTAYLSAISSCAKKGIILKGGAIIDAIAKCKAVAFDKTGTLTTGELSCIAIHPLNEKAHLFGKEKALCVAASLERHVKHPIATAILSMAKKQNLPFAPIFDPKSIPGAGLTALYEGNPCFLGNSSFIEEETKQKLKGSKEGKISMQTYLFVEGALFSFHFADELRKGSDYLIRVLDKKRHMDLFMLTGDEEENAISCASALEIKNVFANLRPEDKLKKVEELSAEKGLIMIGDGVNDAPALARATVGISMGKVGSGSAIAASDVVFLQDDITSLAWLIDKSHKTMRIIKENITFALLVILLVSIPALFGLVPLWLAVILHEGGTLLVGLNSLRLLRS